MSSQKLTDSSKKGDSQSKMTARHQVDKMKTLHPRSRRLSRRPATNRSNASTPPMRTIDLTGFYCRRNDSDYAAAAKATGTTDGTDIYWFREVGNRMVWDDLDQRRSLGLAREMERNRSSMLKIDPKQKETATKKITTVERHVRSDKGVGVKKSSVKGNTAVKDNSAVEENPFSRKPDTIKKDSALEHESNKVADTKGKHKRTRDEETNSEQLSESQPISDCSKIKIDEIADIGVAM
jgi:hypothetical protein